VFQHYLEKMPERERKSLIVPFVSAPAENGSGCGILGSTSCGSARIGNRYGSTKTAGETIARLRVPKNRNRKNPAAGPKSVRAASGRRRTAASRQ
jgi:hypothetical protein